MDYDANRELSKWYERVTYQVKFKDDTTANIPLLNEILLKKSLEKFSIIAAASEALVYKIGRHFITQKIKNDQIALLDGKLVESYIGDDQTPEWKKKGRVEEFFETFGSQFEGKWVIIPCITFKFTVGTAIYFMANFKKIRAIGVIFFSEGPDSLAEILSYNVNDPDFYEFPKKRYKVKRHDLKPDDY